MGDININNVSIRFKTKEGYVRAVNEVNITFKKERITGLIGETGSGKSVLGMSILKLLASNGEVQGEINYKNQNLLGLKEKEIEKIRGVEIGFVPQNPGTSLNPIMKIKKQLREGFCYHQGDSKKEGEIKALDFLKNFSFENPKAIGKSYPFQLSGGMKQRVLCAMGSELLPPWLIADEPTKGLDAIIRYDVYEVFKKLKESLNISMIVITHDLRLAKKVCDEIAVLYCGRILEEGSDIFENPKHPYTIGLIEAQPHKNLKPLPGNPQGLIDLPKGCSFHPRCSQAMNRCKVEEPELFKVPKGRVRCFKYDSR